MKSYKKPTNELIDKALGSFKKEHHRKYFFSRLKNPLWLKLLAERGCFKHPPRSQRFDDGTIQFPYWPEIQYLKNVCREVPDEVINLVMDLPEIDNPVVYDGILDIALQLPGKQSVKLKDKILEYVNMDHQLSRHKYGELLAHWTAENQTSAALEFAKVLAAFTASPQSTDQEMFPDPLPQMDLWDYRDLMFGGVRPLAEREPCQVALILIDATANMIRLQTHPVDIDKEEDGSELWCQRLRESDDDYEDPQEILVHTLTFTCEKVFERAPDRIGDLDQTLRKQQWKIFKRLRQHLYAQYPNEQTKPWIRELILEREDYHQSQYPYEFQQMIRSASKHFGETLLTKEERKRIFNAVCNGPSKNNYQEWRGNDFTEEGFQEHQRYFHRMQLMPFAPVLFGKYEVYFQKLESGNDDQISDEDYHLIKDSYGPVINHSPRSAEDLASLTDENLLNYVNEWEDEDRLYHNNEFIDTNIEALAEEFQTVFTESIISDPNRFQFWMENREKIERPIYVRMIIKAIATQVKAKNFDNLNEGLTFSKWVLSHSDQKPKSNYGSRDKSRENPDWSRARRAVCDFISTCLGEDVDVPITVQKQLTILLDILCTQFDWRLDWDKPILLDREDPITEGINNTRSLALQELVNFGFWLQRHGSEREVPEVMTILEKRFVPEREYPLTIPEYAVLAVNYQRIFYLNEMWAVKHKSDFFPQDQLSAWLAAFGCFLSYSRPFQRIFEILKDDFNFALQRLGNFKNHKVSRRTPIDHLGQHLFTYYLWGMYSLAGKESLLERFYQRTEEKKEHWANLFKHIGRRLCNSGENLNLNIKDRVIAFFEWRLKQKEPMELRHFTSWLQAEGLNAGWRLDAYSKILDVCDIGGRPIGLEALCDMLPDHTAKVIECFAKLTANTFYIRSEEAKAILKAGLESKDENVRRNAKDAHENLLKAGRHDLLDLDD
ncbi:MAG: hypothetical protein OXI43_12060 [Candidatus Poribacteria bacterium]|nr:hypothetical protein [Candidatus Poribacteria bacterium]